MEISGFVSTSPSQPSRLWSSRGRAWSWRSRMRCWWRPPCRTSGTTSACCCSASAARHGTQSRDEWMGCVAGFEGGLGKCCRNGTLIYQCIYLIYSCIWCYILLFKICCQNTCIHAYMHTCMHAYMHACMHACMHAYIHTFIHACMQTYVHTCNAMQCNA